MSTRRNPETKTVTEAATAITTPDNAIELDETQLENVTGGGDSSLTSWKVSPPRETSFPSKWKMASFDGKGNDVVTEEIVFVVENVKRP